MDRTTDAEHGGRRYCYCSKSLYYYCGALGIGKKLIYFLHVTLYILLALLYTQSSERCFELKNDEIN